MLRVLVGGTDENLITKTYQREHIANMAQFIDPQQFATLDAPYIKYLEKIKSEWVEAEILENNL